MAMKASVLISTLKQFAAEPTKYDNKTTQWMKWNGSAWLCDCSRMIKGIGWGFSFDKSASHGGAKYLTNNVKDTTANGMIETCSAVTDDFTSITPGECVWLSGHAGIYIGGGQVIEATPAWSADGATYSEISSTGARSKNGKSVSAWAKHGKLPWVTYDTTLETLTDTTETTNTSTAATATTIEAGMKLTLDGVPLYSSSTATKQANTVTGTYYLWDGKKVKSRYRITNKKANVGVSGQVTGWIDAEHVV